MYDKLIEKLKQQRALITKTRKDYPELARQAKRNVVALEKQIKLARKAQQVTRKSYAGETHKVPLQLPLRGNYERIRTKIPRRKNEHIQNA